jgi:hypothetical protein
MLPISYRSSGAGSSLAADFWATSTMLFPDSIAASSALIDFGRPTKSGMTMCGKTTTSRSGRSGSCVGVGLDSSEGIEIHLKWRQHTDMGGSAPLFKQGRRGFQKRD